MNDLVSLIVRTSFPERLPLLKLAIDSIVANHYRPIEVIIVVQTLNSGFIDQVRSLLALYQKDDFQTRVILNPTEQDQRAKNLNLGLEAATGRYVGFLDDDDVLYPHHLESLITALTQSPDKTWAYADVALVEYHLSQDCTLQKIKETYPFKREDFELNDFLRGSFIPIHAYLLDAYKIKSKFLRFDESFIVSEDNAFLVQLISQYEPLYVPIVTAEYRVFDNYQNSNLILNEEKKKLDKAKIRQWKYSYFKLELLKSRLFPKKKIKFLIMALKQYILYLIPMLSILKKYQN